MSDSKYPPRVLKWSEPGWKGEVVWSCHARLKPTQETGQPYEAKAFGMKVTVDPRVPEGMLLNPDLHPDNIEDEQIVAGISMETYERLYAVARELEAELAYLRGKVEMLTADIEGLIPIDSVVAREQRVLEAVARAKGLDNG